jgi:hypothetical protein
MTEIKDRVYKCIFSDFESINKLINSDELLKRLYTCSALNRLQFVYQQGITAKLNTQHNLVKYYGHRPIFRYEHSIGVSLLAYYFCQKAKLSDYETKKQMIIGLLHDISHIAFSHVADSVFGEQYHEVHREEIIKKNKELYELLLEVEKEKKYNIDLERDILHDESDSKLIKAKNPHINCDRLDYFLRDGHLTGVFSLLEVSKILQHVNLSLESGILYFDDINYAKLFYDRTFSIAADNWNGAESIIPIGLFTQVIQHATKEKVISKEDLINKKDDEIFETLKTNYSKEINIIVNQQYSTIVRSNEIELPFLKHTYYYIYINDAKLRVLDPLVKYETEYKKLSELSDRVDGNKKHYEKEIRNKLKFIVIFDEKQKIFETK